MSAKKVPFMDITKTGFWRTLPPLVKVDVCFRGLEAERKKVPHLHNQGLERTASTSTNGGKGSQESDFDNMRTAPYFANTGVNKNTFFCLPLVWNPTVLDSAAHSER